MADIVLINPKFGISFWGMEYALPFLGKSSNMPTAALPLLAALTPEEHQITLIDENIEEIDFERVAKADLVGLTGMSVQRFRMVEILNELKKRHIFTVVGGPWVTVKQDYFDGLCDAIFIGEAERTWPQFLLDWKQGTHQKRYEQTEPTDMTSIPVPRTDLLKAKHYINGSIQFSRGCPFLCEFCDIIVTFGRKPRLKNAQQIINELDALRTKDFLRVFIVDDNFIGNKKAIKLLLKEVIAYQWKHGFPFTFFTEVSLDLSKDDELMQLMVEANITKVFIGIESPNADSLKETRKNQNIKSALSMTEQVIKIQDAGMEVTCGMILGFDHDDTSIFAAQKEFIKEARIPIAGIGMLHAIPRTPLYKRLAEEERLDLRDMNEFGTNVIPKLLSREELRDGYIDVMNALYEPDAFFGRIEALFIEGKLDFGRGRKPYWKKHPWQYVKAQSGFMLKTFLFYHHLMRSLPDRSMVAVYRKHFKHLMFKQFNPALWLYFIVTCAMHYHLHTLAKNMRSGDHWIQSNL